MKSLLLTGLLFWTVLAGLAQNPETIPSFASHPKETGWYKTQSKLWEKRITENPKDVVAWQNYFAANRILCAHDELDTRTQAQKDAFMKELVSRMGKEIPESYEFNFCSWQVGGNDMSNYHYLQKAIEINPDRTEHIDYMINIGEIERNSSQRDEYSRRKYRAGKFSTGLLYYNYNVLQSVEPQSILISAGDNDTYPVWYLQSLGIQKDVYLLNLSLLQIDSYREKVFRELGIPAIPEITDEKKFRTDIMNALIHNKKKRPVYVALTASQYNGLLDQVNEQTYLCGLAYRYSSEPMDNMAVLRNRFENHFTLDYVLHPFYSEMAEERIREVNRNYLVPMLKLYHHYRESGDQQKQEKIKEMILAISRGTVDEKTTLDYLNKSEPRYHISFGCSQ